VEPGAFHSARFKGIEATFGYGQAAVDRGTASLPGVATPAEAAGAIEPPVAGHIEQVDWSKNGDLFWLGYDLLWTVDTLLRGGPALDITWGLNQALHHARSIGFQDAAITGSLSGLREAALDNCDDDWTARRRNDVASTRLDLEDRVAALEKNQAEQAGLVEKLAEQLENVAAAGEALNRRVTILLAISSAALLIGLVALLLASLR